MRQFVKRYGQWIVGTCVLLIIGTMWLLRRQTIPDIAARLDTQERPVIVWGVKADTNLFGWYDIETDSLQGFDIDLARALTAEITGGRGEAQFVEVTAKTRIPLLKNGVVDAVLATMTITEARKKVVSFTDVYFHAGQSLLVAEHSEINGLADLQLGHRILALKGATSAQKIRELAPQATVLEMENYGEAFIALQSHQGDALTTDNAILLGIMAQNPGYRLAGMPFTEEPFGIATDHHQEAFVAQLNQALVTLRANGIYDALYDKWFGPYLESEGSR